MSLTLALLFHFNQHLNEHALLASQVCYRGLLRVLRARPAVKANLHISGTLLHALQWLDPEPLELIRDGLAAGQFELLGSTYAQNVLYASDDWDNARQIELHQQVLHDAFGVAPTTFWNVERCWRQSLAPLIAGAGYRTVLIEDHILEASGASGPYIFQTHTDNQPLKVVRDDERLKHLFNFAAWFGRPHKLHAYLTTIADHHSQPPLDQPYLAYAEDAEAMGLWGYHQGIDPRQTWSYLAELLDSLASQPGLITGLLAQAPDPIADNSPIAEGCAAWMDASLTQAGLPYHEDGYQDWFDFQTRSPKLADYRRFYSHIRARLDRPISAYPGAQSLYQAALHTFLAHQFEFGCIGVGRPGYRGWDGAQAALVFARAAEWAENFSLRPSARLGHLPPTPFLSRVGILRPGTSALTPRPSPVSTTGEGSQFPPSSAASARTGEGVGGEGLKLSTHLTLEDLNEDGYLEVSQSDGPALLITSPLGGRLLYWLDLVTGQQYLGNPLSVVPGPYQGDAVLPPISTHPNFWVPEHEPDSSTPLSPEVPPTRLAKFLPAWIWTDEPEPFLLAARDMHLPGETPYRTAQRRGLVDEITLDGQDPYDPGELLAARLVGNTVVYTRPLTASITLEKSYALTPYGVQVEYRFANSGSTAHHIHLTTTSELCLSYEAVLRFGRRALEFTEIEGYPGVRNPLSGEALYIQPSRPWHSITQTEALLALNLGLSFELDLLPEKLEVLTLRLLVTNSLSV